MFCFVLLGMPSQYSLAGNIHHFKNKEYFYQMNEMIAKKVMQENLRQTPTYQRIMKLCLHPDQLQNYVYSSSAAGQAFSIGSGDPDAYQTALRLGSTVSPLLTFDLQQDSFYFALDECGYSESGKNWFVASLIAQDIAGKFATGVGIISMAKVSLKLIHLLKQKSKKLFYGLSAAGIAGIIYQTFQQYEKLTNPFESNNQIIKYETRMLDLSLFSSFKSTCRSIK